MMPQMEPGDAQEQVQPTYGRYEGAQQKKDYAQQQYEAPFYRGGQSQQGGLYDEEFIEMLAQRIAQRIVQGPGGKIQPTQPRDRASAGQKLALAVVSLVLLVPLAGILVAGVGGVGGLIAFGGACVTMFLVNAVYAEKG